MDINTQDKYKQEILKSLDAGIVGRAVGQVVGAVVGGVVGFFLGGPMGAISGAMMGWSLGGVADPSEPAELSFGYQGSTSTESRSPRYGFGTLSNTSTNEVSVPIIYGALKVAGNTIYQSAPGSTVYRCVGLSEGEITSILDVRVNDRVIGTIPTGGTPGQLFNVAQDPLVDYTGQGSAGHIAVWRPTYQVFATTPTFQLLRADRIKAIPLTLSSGGQSYPTWAFNYAENYCYFDNAIGYSLARANAGTMPFVANYTAEADAIEDTSCTYTAYLGTATQNVDSRFSSDVDGLRYLAYLAVTLKVSDQLKGGNPTITCVVQGMKVSTWGGSAWTVAKTFSRNPVACLRDLLTNSRYGGGVSEAAIDATTWGSAYEYCDEDVQRIDGVSNEARACLDYVVDGKRPIIDVIGSILSTFNGFLVFSGSKIKLKIEKNESVSQAFNMSNIIRGGFSYSKVSKDALPNRIKVQYIDPAYNYTKIFAQADDPIDQANRRALGLGEDIVTQELALLGITRYSQAARQAKIFLHLAQSCSTYCMFSVSSDALAVEVGDIISVTHDVPRWSAKKFRVLAIEATKDDNLKLSCREYDSSIYDGYASGAIAPDYSDVSEDYTAPNEPRNFTVTQDLAGIQFAWEAPISIFGVTINSIEIRRGSVWSTAEVITSSIGASALTYTSTNEHIGTAVYLIKSYSTYGIYSTNAAKDCISSTMPAPYDPVYKYDEFTSLGGSLTSGLRREWTTDFSDDYYRKTIAIDNSTAQHQWDATSEVWDNSNIVYDEGPYEAGQQTYTCVEIDLGADFTASMQVAYATTGGATSIEWRYKKDGDAYGAYAVFTESSFTFRYCQFRVKMTTVSSFYTMKLTSFAVSAYIDDVTESGSTSIVNANSGIYATFTKTYAVTPKVVLFTDGMSDYEPRISDITTTGFTAKIYDTTNNIYKTGDVGYFIANY